MLPDIILKEFYLEQYHKAVNNKYKYQVFDANTTKFPPVVILTDEKVESSTQLTSDKRNILTKLDSQGYVRVKAFNFNSSFYGLFNSTLDYYMSGLIQSPTEIAIYEKK